MGRTTLRKLGASLALIAACALSHVAAADAVHSDSCNQKDVQRAIARAGNGDVVDVPAGNCVWNSFEISKGIHLHGAGAEATNVTISGTVGLSKNARHSIELSGFTFRLDRSKTRRMFYVVGAWESEPPLIHDNVFDIADSRFEDHNAGILLYESNGGVIYRNTFRGNLDDSGIQHKLIEENPSWSEPDTIGDHDTDGKHNLYVEDNVFEGMANQATDFDDGSRIVFRHNTLVSSSFNTHGLATSPVGVRHFEIYNNTFGYPDLGVNQNWHVWLRGGTGVIYGNSFDDITGQEWGDKAELQFSVRAVEDGTPEGCCTSWPCKHQLGQNSDGKAQFHDPILLWDNTGTLETRINTGWSDACGQDIHDYLQEGREYIFSTSPKSGYRPYTHPHPLRDDVVRPEPPHSVVVNP